MKKGLIGLTAIVVLIASFQNCSQVSFEMNADSIAVNSLSTTDTLVETNMNTPVDFEVLNSLSMTGMQIKFEALRSGSPLNGAFEVLDLNRFKLRYSPNFGFRGNDYAVARVQDKYGNELKFNITVIVGNSLRALEPALAIRGMGCIQCHAQVASNILTDFGYKNDYYFSAKPGSITWNSGGVYGDHGSSFNTMALPADKNVIVPKATLPNMVSAATGLATLADYIRDQLAKSSFTSTQGTKVIEKSSLYIGAPTDADITTAFKLGASERFKYFKDSDAAVALSGLSDAGTFFKNSGILQCEGDLALRGPLLLDKLKIQSKTGCRLYVLGSVFLYGEISYIGTDSDRNLQITSTKSISLGLGVAKKDGVFCEPKGRYATDSANYGTSSLVNRYTTFWTVPGNFVRQSQNPKAFGQSILAEADVVQAKAGPLYDASCRAEGRNISFERILLNAPIIHSRYEGNVSGTIIAEFSIMSLNMFKFSFDPVFSRVPVFPFLDPSTYLDVKD